MIAVIEFDTTIADLEIRLPLRSSAGAAKLWRGRVLCDQEAIHLPSLLPPTASSVPLLSRSLPDRPAHLCVTSREPSEGAPQADLHASTHMAVQADSEPHCASHWRGERETMG